jgi:predicted transcriptional regulator
VLRRLFSRVICKCEQKVRLAEERAAIQLDITRRASAGETYESIASSYGVTRQSIEKLINRLSGNQKASKIKGA